MDDLPSPLSGIQIQLHTESQKAPHSAILLGQTGSNIPPGFTSLPLLLLRMPANVREIVLDFLSRAFDIRVSPLKLRSPFLTSSLESYLSHAAEQPSAGGVQLQLSFPTVTPLLKNLDISISPKDVRRFMHHGERSVQAQMEPQRGLFLNALEACLSNHLALELSSPAVRVSKVVCAAFALGTEGKVKLFAATAAEEDGQHSNAVPREAIGKFLVSLVVEAEKGMESTLVVGKGKEREKAGEVQTATQGRSSMPADPPPPYAEHDPRLVL